MVKRVKFILFIAAMLVTVAAVVIAAAKWPNGISAGVNSNEGVGSDPQTTTSPNPPSTLPAESRQAATEEYLKKLLLLMDTDKSGRVSKKEWMDFMSKQFDLLDTNHDGQLDVKELARFHERPCVGK